ncbi:hypothetical protein LSPH26S_03833 [Lysinibacillus sphaericus]
MSVDPRLFRAGTVARFAQVRPADAGAVREPHGRGHARAVHARCQPREMASGAHHLVLRDLRALARSGVEGARAGLELPTPTTSGSVQPGCRRATGASSRRQGTPSPARGSGHHRRHLVHRQHRDHERAGQVVPAMGDQHAQLGVVRHCLAQLADRAFAGIVVLVPQAVHLVAERVVSDPVTLPAHSLGDEVDHRRGGRRDDAVEQRVAGALLRRVRERVPRGDVGMAEAAQLVGAIDLAQVGLGFDAAAGALDEHRVQSGQLGDLADHRLGGGRIGAALHQRAAYSPRV